MEPVKAAMDHDQAHLDLEREKWDAEVRLRERELALKEREQGWSRWTNPLVVALLAATAAAVGNLVIAFINGSQQLAVEESKAESARVLEMIKTGNSDKAADNLSFLVETGLVNERERVERIRAFLSRRSPGTGPSLPVPGSPFQFEPTSALTGAIQGRIERILNRYTGYLETIGFTGVPEDVRIRIDNPRNNLIAYYEGTDNTMVIDVRYAGDDDVVLREYTHHVLISTLKPPGSSPEPRAIESGVADYFPCSFSNDPQLAQVTAAALGISKGYLRSLADFRGFAELSGNTIPQYGGEIWGAALWAARDRLGKNALDPLIALVWQRPGWATAGSEAATVFIDALVQSARDAGREPEAEEILKVFRERGFPVRS